MEITELEREKLKERLINSKEVYTILRHVSKSGMFRLISVYTFQNNEPFCWDWEIERLGIAKRDKKREGLRISGAGMDMGFHIVNRLFYALCGTNYNWQQNHKRWWL